MWLVTKSGFVSIVRDRKDPSKVWVRARIEGDIEGLLPEYADQVTLQAGADYCWRLLVPKTAVAVALMEQVMDLSYTGHAKESMNATSPKSNYRMKAYYACWNALAEMQEPYAPYSHVKRVRYTPPAKHYGTIAKFADKPAAQSAAVFKSGDYNWDNHPQSATYHGGWDDSLDGASAAWDLAHGIPQDLPVSAADDVVYNDGLTQAEYDAMTPDQYTQYLIESGFEVDPETGALTQTVGAVGETEPVDIDVVITSETTGRIEINHPKPGTKPWRAKRTAQRREQRRKQRERAAQLQAEANRLK